MRPRDWSADARCTVPGGRGGCQRAGLAACVPCAAGGLFHRTHQKQRGGAEVVGGGRWANEDRREQGGGTAELPSWSRGLLVRFSRSRSARRGGTAVARARRYMFSRF